MVRFTLTRTSWVSAEIGYNFFTSHAELDMVKDTAKSSKEAVVVSQLDFIHGAGHKLDARLILSDTLDPGDYVLRVADDHYSGQVDGGSQEGCFPFSFELVVVPDQAPPTVVSVLPHPSVPIPRGADLVVTLRFSQPPKGSIEDVVNSLSLGGVQAHLAGSGSINNLATQYARRQTNVQAAVTEGHKVWVVTFLADALADMSEAALEMAPLRSNLTGRLFRFNAPRYKFGFPANAPPWGGGQELGGQEAQVDQFPAGESDGNDNSDNGVDAVSASSGMAIQSEVASGVGAAVPEGGVASASSGSQGSIGSAQPEGQGAASSMAARLGLNSGGGSGGIGAARSEGRGVSSAATSDDVSSGAVGQARPEGQIYKATPIMRFTPAPPPPPPVYGNTDAIVPRVVEWRPPTPAPPKSSDSSNDCPEGTVLNAETGICETGSPGWPVGYRFMVFASTAGVAAFLFLYVAPRYRRGGAGALDKAARFRDIGVRSSHEEQSLMSSVDLDDDML